MGDTADREGRANMRQDWGETQEMHKHGDEGDMKRGAQRKTRRQRLYIRNSEGGRTTIT